MSLVLLTLQGAALACAALALALPAYVFVVLVWSSLTTLAATVHHEGTEAAGRLGVEVAGRLARIRHLRARHHLDRLGKAVALN